MVPDAKTQSYCARIIFWVLGKQCCSRSAKGGSYSRTSFSVNKFEKIISRYKSHNRTDLLWLLADNKPCLGPVVTLANFCSLGFLGRLKFHEALVRWWEGVYMFYCCELKILNIRLKTNIMLLKCVPKYKSTSILQPCIFQRGRIFKRSLTGDFAALLTEFVLLPH